MNAKLSIVYLLILCVAGFLSADTNFYGGDVGVASNWDNGIPATDNDGFINIDGELNGTVYGQRYVWMVGATVTVGNGATLTCDPDVSAYQGTLIVNDATIDCVDDFFCDYATIILNAGSVTTCTDDWESNDSAGKIIVNGGTHQSGMGTGNNVGAQGNSSKVGCGIDFLGGTVTAGNFRFQNYSTSSVGGTAVLNTHPGGTFSDASGDINILLTWSGSWTVDSFTTGSWESLVTNASNGFTLNGEAIDTTTFASAFVVSADGKTLNLVPKWAHNPTPETGTTEVALTETLGWTTGLDESLVTNTDITKHYLYMLEGEVGDDPNFAELTPTEVTGVDPSGVSPTVTLQMDKRYFWRVDESVQDSAYADANTITGNVWYFDTIKSVPEITVDPVNSAVFAGDDVTLSVEFTSVSAITGNVWEVSTDNGATWTEVSVTAALDEVSTPKTSSITIAATEGDEGLYRCTITNNGGADTSDTAEVVIKRLLAYYEFESDLTDSAYGNDGTAVHSDGLTPDITYTTGIVGDAVVFNASSDPEDPNQSYVQLPATAYPNAKIGGGLKTGTIFCWIKTDNVGTVIGTLNDEYTTGFSFGVQGDTYARLFVRDDNANQIQPTMNEDDLTAGTDWYFIAATWDYEGTSRTFIGKYGENAKRIAEVSSSIAPVLSDWSYPMTLGALNSRGAVQDFFENGTAVDDLQIYNYAFTQEEIAAVYNEVTGLKTCISYSYEGSGFDFNGDCVVDLLDFADFSGAWLATGLTDGN